MNIVVMDPENAPLLHSLHNGGSSSSRNNSNHNNELSSTTSPTSVVHSPIMVNYGCDHCKDDKINHHRHQNEKNGMASTGRQERKSNPKELVRSLHRSFSSFISHHTGSIGWLGSMAIAVNSLTGPAMLTLPSTFQKSGILPTLITIGLVCILSSLCSLHMANTISKVPGNAQFQQHIEYSEVFRRFWGNRWFVLTQVVFFGSVTCLNISSIVDTARVMDTILGQWWYGSVALQFNTTALQRVVAGGGGGRGGVVMMEWTRWAYTDCHHKEKCVPFFQQKHEDGVFLLTMGYVITTISLLPLALMDLKENSLCQIVGFLVLLVVSIQFGATFAVSESFDWNHVSWWGESWQSLFGVILFNFCLVIAIPAWLYEKEPHVPVPAVIHSSYGLASFLYVFIGLLGACSMPHVSENMLENMMSGAMGTAMQMGASIFALVIIGFGVPLFSVLTRLNLTGSGTCTDRVGNLLAVYLPFGISWMLYHRVTQLLTWGGVLFTSFVAFLLPLFLAWYTVQHSESPGSIDVCEGWDGSSCGSSCSMCWGTSAHPMLLSTPLTLQRKESNTLATLLVLAATSVFLAFVGIVLG